jgi:hypothetical protein
MRREPSLTFEGALRILGHHEPRLIGKLDTVLGGVILASGAGIAAATLGGPPLASAAMFAAACAMRNPSMNRPCDATREPNTATPSTLPVWRVVFSVPEAIPDRDRFSVAGSTVPRWRHWRAGLIWRVWGVGVRRRPAAGIPGSAGLR